MRPAIRDAPAHRRRAVVLVGGLLLAAGTATLVRQRYLGFSEGIWHQMRYASLRENRNLWQCTAYFIDLMEMLTFDPRTGLWSFDATGAAGRSGMGPALLAFHRGRYSEAIERLEARIRQRGESEEALFWLAMSTMRRAEAENCLQPLRAAAGGAGAPATGGAVDRAAYCALPLRRFHRRRADSRRAIRLWSRLLDRYRPGDRLYLWLLNLSAMTVDGFPDEVPPRHRIATPFIDSFYGEGAARVRTANADLRFHEDAAGMGVANLGAGRGAAVEDFDRDGDLDLVTADFFGTVRYYRNEAGSRFVEATREAGLSGVAQALSLSAADYDNDGWVDLLAIRPLDSLRLFRNLGGGRFADVTDASGLLDCRPPGTLTASWFAAWGDVDGDGDLDLFLTSWAFRVPFATGVLARPRLESKLFVNDRGRFRDATAQFGLDGVVRDRQFVGAAFGDYDRDGRPDLFLSGPVPATSTLLHNVGGERFARVELPAGFTEPGFTAAFVDVDQDGRLDIFQGGFNDARTATARTVFGDEGPAMGASTFLVQTADGGFEERPELFGGGMATATMGASYGDLDNDGCLDFYLGTGGPEPWFILPNAMYRGRREGARCTGAMDDVSAIAGFANLQKGHAVVFFDVDGDGDQDVFSVLGGMWPADVWVSELFVNDSHPERRWVDVRLRGRRTNYYGVGATVKVTARRPDGGSLVRYRQIDTATGFGSPPLLAHFGLLDAVAIERVEVDWPVSGCHGVYAADLGRLNVLDEADCGGGGAR